MKILQPPFRYYMFVVLLSAGLGLSFAIPSMNYFLFFAAFVGALPIMWKALKDIFVEFKISIDVFNSFVLAIAFSMGDPKSAGFIILMLTFADFLDWKTESRAHHAIEELLKLNPPIAIKEEDGKLIETPLEKIAEGDIIVVENGARVPVDGVIIYGSALLNEASVSGESMPIKKVIGEHVYSSTLNESGVIKIRATGVGKNSTIERMVELVKDASSHKSRSEKMADKFAGIFLPLLLLFGIGTYFYTGSITMVVSLFLVACADDMAVAIPLAMTASLGRGARRGVVIKGGEWFDALATMKTLVVDKTGTLTFGKLKLESVHIEPSVDEAKFWGSVAIAEKFSEHPVGRAIFREAFEKVNAAVDPEEFKLYGGGIYARHGNSEIFVGNEKLFETVGIALNEKAQKAMRTEKKEHRNTTVLVYLNKQFAGVITIADVIHPEAKRSIEEIKKLGVENIVMFTGDNEEIAREVAADLGITEYRSKMTPEMKLLELEKFANGGVVGMVGDGVNDAPSLARANVGIAIGDGGTATAIEVADVVLLSGNLNRIPEMIRLSRATISVINWDMVIWLVSNLVGFGLVFSGIIGPVFAAFYNFATDFFPLLNSARLFKEKI